MTKKHKLISLILAVVLVISLAGCSGNRESVGSVGDISLSGDNFYYIFLNNILSLQSSNNISFNDIKDQMTPFGTTYEAYFQDSSVDYIAQVAVVDLIYDELGLVWGDEQEQAFQAELDSYYSQLQGGRNDFKKNFESYGFDISVFENMSKTNYKFSQITEALYGENGTTPIKASEATEAFYNDYARVKNILIPTVDTSTMQPLSDAELEQAEALYDECMDKIAALEPGDEKGFNALLEEYNKDPGMESNPDGYIVTDDGSFVTEFTDASLTVDVNGYTSCESDYGYHIIMRLPLREEDMVSEFGSVENYVTSYISNMAYEYIEERMEELGITKNDSAIKKITKEALKKV